MSEDLPYQTAIRCTECDTDVYLARKDNGLLYVRCDCSEQRSIKVATTLPTDWEEGP